MVLLVAIATAAPVKEDHVDVHPDLGESAATGVKQEPTPQQALEVMTEGLKLWKEGETKDGDESMDKLDTAFGKLEDKAFAKAANKAEHMVEESVLVNHAPHPRQIAKDSAKEIERGLQMAATETGDDIKQFQNEVKRSEAQAVAQGGTLKKKQGKYVEKELTKSIKMEKKGVEYKSKMNHYIDNHPKAVKALEDAKMIPQKDIDAFKTEVMSLPTTASTKDIKTGAESDAEAPVSAPKAVSLMELAESKQEYLAPLVKQGLQVTKESARLDKKSVGHPNLAKKYADQVEKDHGYAVEKSPKTEKASSETKTSESSGGAATTSADTSPAAAQPTQQATAAATAPAKQQKAPAKQQKAAAAVPAAAAAVVPAPVPVAAPAAAPASKKLSKAAIAKEIAPFVQQVMQKVDAQVDMQFTPVEEQLGYNLHKEAQLAKNQERMETTAATKEKNVLQQSFEQGLASNIGLAAQQAEKEAATMKAAVKKAQEEHRAAQKADPTATATTGATQAAAPAAVPASVELLQLGESSKPPATFSLPEVHIASLRPEVEKDAVKIMASRNKIDSTVMKAMRDAEAKLNTELAPVEPQAMHPVKTLNDALDRTLTGASANSEHIKKEEELMESLDEAPPIALIQEKATPPKTPPKSFDPYTESVPVSFQLPDDPLGDVQGRVQKDVGAAIKSHNLLESLTKMAVQKAEDDDENMFKGMIPQQTATYKLEKNINSALNKIENAATNANVNAAAQVAEGKLPNGQPATPN